jgi:hypothetical protein
MRMADLISPQLTCGLVDAQCLMPQPQDKLGLSSSARTDVPVHGLRMANEEGLSGWYIWSGDWSDDEGFFEPTHIEHMSVVCPLAMPFLGLPPGWRFLTDGDYVDVWFDQDLLP